MERVKRIFQELNEEWRHYLQTDTQQFETLFSQFKNNLHQRQKIIESFNKRLDMYEQATNFENLDVFAKTNFETDDITPVNGGLLS